jgi:hypothetical protein
MGIQDEVSKLVGSSSAKHKRLIEYVVRQVRNDRHLRDVLEDPYVTNRLSPLERRALLEEPEVVGAVQQDVLEGMRAHLETVLSR